jgi:hypothetical protein
MTDIFSGDVGFTYRVWRRFTIKTEIDFTPGSISIKSYNINAMRYGGSKDRSKELYVGLIADVFLKPSLYYSYDTTWKRHNIEARASYLYELFGGLALDFSAKAGYDHTQRPAGEKDFFKSSEEGSVIKVKKGYLYGGAGADLVYAFNEAAKASIGVRYEGIQKRAWACARTESGKPRRQLCWFTAAVEGSF